MRPHTDQAHLPAKMRLDASIITFAKSSFLLSPPNGRLGGAEKTFGNE